MRKLAAFAVSFAGGIFLAQYLLPTVWQLRLCAAFCALFLLGFLLRKQSLSRRRFCLITAGLALALAYNWVYTTLIQLPAASLNGEQQTVTMTLCDYAEPTDYGARVTVRLAGDGIPRGKVVYYGGKALLERVPGNTVTNTVRLSDASVIREDEVTTFTSRGVYLLAYSRGEETFDAGSADSPRWWPQRLGRAMGRQIDTLFEGDVAAFLAAILIGDRTAVPESVQTDLTQAGLYHILAISGMHCAFLLGLVQFLLGKQRRKLVAAVALPLLVFYALLAGGSPSVVRACLMLAFLLIGPLFGRESDPATSISAALMAILLANPFAAASVSLQLSFSAIAGICFVSPRLYELLGEKTPGRLRRLIAGSVSASVGALVFSAPLSGYYFNNLTLLAPLGAFLCLWAAGLIFSVGLLAVAGSFLYLPIGTVLGTVPAVLIRYLLAVSHWIAGLPYHALNFSNPYLKYWLMLVYVLFAIACLLREKCWWKYPLCVLLSAVCLVFTIRQGTLRYTYGQLDILALDVGQGQSILLESDGAFALVDCGSMNSWISAGAVAADMLQSMGCQELDCLMLTHYDYDHVSGVTELLYRMKVKRLLVPNVEDDIGLRDWVLELAERQGTEVQPITEKTELPLGEATVTAFPPLGAEGDNERGLVYLCSAGDYDLLIPGDIGSETEKLLLETYELPDIEALVVGHHGSKYSTSEELLEALRPEAALISVGSNSYGHPTDQTLQRLMDAGAEIYRTDLQGTIHLSVQ